MNLHGAGWSVLGLLVLAACNDSAGTFDYDLTFVQPDRGTIHVNALAMGSGVVSGYGYNRGLYAVSYQRIELDDGEPLDIFLTFDVPVAADKTTVRNVCVKDQAYVHYVEESPDGTVLYQNEEPAGSEFCVEELYMDDDGAPGTVVHFAIDLGARRISSGRFVTDETASDVRGGQEDREAAEE